MLQLILSVAFIYLIVSKFRGVFKKSFEEVKTKVKEFNSDINTVEVTEIPLDELYQEYEELESKLDQELAKDEPSNARLSKITSRLCDLEEEIERKNAYKEKQKRKQEQQDSTQSTAEDKPHVSIAKKTGHYIGEFVGGIKEGISRK